MNLKTLFQFIFILLFTSSYGQELLSDTVRLDRNENNVYGSVGTLWIHGMAASLNYERLISEQKNGFIKSYWFRAGSGLYWAWENGTDRNFILGITALSGARNSHLETLLGVSAHYSINKSSDRFRFLPAGAIGYRFQKPNGLFMFRVGLGFPENAYMSLGFSF